MEHSCTGALTGATKGDAKAYSYGSCEFQSRGTGVIGVLDTATGGVVRVHVGSPEERL